MIYRKATDFSMTQRVAQARLRRSSLRAQDWAYTRGPCVLSQTAHTGEDRFKTNLPDGASNNTGHNFCWLEPLPHTFASALLAKKALSSRIGSCTRFLLVRLFSPASS